MLDWSRNPWLIQTGLCVGPLKIGMTVNEVFELCKSWKLEFVCDLCHPLHVNLVIRILELGVHLCFHPLFQCLTDITVTIGKKKDTVWGECEEPPLSRYLKFRSNSKRVFLRFSMKEVEASFGKDYETSFTDNTYSMCYSQNSDSMNQQKLAGSATFLFVLSKPEHERLISNTKLDGPSPTVSKFTVSGCLPSTVSRAYWNTWLKSVLPHGGQFPFPEPLQVKIKVGEGVYLSSANLSSQNSGANKMIQFGASLQDILTDLGVPNKVTPLEIATKPRQFADLNQLGNKIDCYMLSYFPLGLDLCMHAPTHSLLRILLHNNLPGHQFFGIHSRCFFCLYLPSCNVCQNVQASMVKNVAVSATTSIEATSDERPEKEPETAPEKSGKKKKKKKKKQVVELPPEDAVQSDLLKAPDEDSKAVDPCKALRCIRFDSLWSDIEHTMAEPPVGPSPVSVQSEAPLTHSLLYCYPGVIFEVTGEHVASVTLFPTSTLPKVLQPKVVGLD
eukprot:Platyproteum_vivax@DN5266_c0_g1_i2.p1